MDLPNDAETPEEIAEEASAPACILSFNASDASGAGGIAGDVATIAAMGAHALPVITSVLMRDTAEIFDQHVIDADAVVEQARCILEDITVSGFKVGFLGNTDNVSAVAEVLSDYPDVPLVSYLPALSFMEDDDQNTYLDAFRELILPATEVLVGNHKTLTDFLLPDWDSDRPASPRELAVAAAEHGTRFVLVTGVMLPAKGAGQFIDNVLASPQGALTGEKFEMFEATFVGAGDTLSAAMAALLGAAAELQAAVGEALQFLDQSLDAGFRPGMGGVVPDRFFWALAARRGRGRRRDHRRGARRTTRRKSGARAVSINEALFARAQKVIPGGVNSPVRAFKAVGGTPRFIARGEGAYIVDAEGKRYVDYIGSWGPMILGHGHPAVLDAVLRAARDGFSFGAPTEREVELAEEIIRHVPSVEQVRLVSSGTEACMSAIRLARAATGRSRLIKFEGCYHGHADALLVKAGSGLATFGHPTSAGVPSEVVQHTTVLDFNNVAQLEEAFATHGDELACVIIEPIAGNMNFVRTSVAVHDAAARAVPPARRAADHGRGHDGLPRGARRRAEPLRAADPRLRARHQRVRQGHRRRHAAGRVRRVAQDHGAARAAGPGLPGGHAVGQPGGHRLRPGDAARDLQARLPRRARRAARASWSTA